MEHDNFYIHYTEKKLIKEFIKLQTAYVLYGPPGRINNVYNNYYNNLDRNKEDVYIIDDSQNI